MTNQYFALTFVAILKLLFGKGGLSLALLDFLDSSFLQFVLVPAQAFFVSIDNRVAKCDVTKIKISEFVGFVKIIREIKTKNVSLQKIRMLVEIVGKI